MNKDMDGPMVKAMGLESFLGGVSRPPVVKVKDRNETPFVAHLSGPDPEDRKWELTKSLVKDGKTIDGFTAVAPNEFYNYAARKMDRELLANYEGWAINQIDLSTPESAQFWNKVVPWVVEKREAFLEEQAAIQKQLAKIKIRGVQSEEDLMLIFALQNGLVQVMDSPLYKLDSGDYQAPGAQVGTTFTSGLLNPYSSYFINRDKPNYTTNNSAVPVYNFKDPLGAAGDGMKLSANQLPVYKNWTLTPPAPIAPVKAVAAPNLLGGI